MPRRLMPRHRIFVIEWMDASDAFGQWQRLSSIKASDREQLVQSVGYLVDEDEDWITLATSCVDAGDDEHFGGGIHIPKPLVRSRLEVE
jgi:hypothetical protein